MVIIKPGEFLCCMCMFGYFGADSEQNLAKYKGWFTVLTQPTNTPTEAGNAIL